MNGCSFGDLCRDVIVQEIHRYNWINTLPIHLSDLLLDHYTSKKGIVDLALLKLISDASVVKMLLGLKTTLVSISFTRCSFEKNVDLTELGSFLLEVEINECEWFTMKELKSLGSGTFLKLERLRLASLSPISGRIMNFIMPSLRSLELYRATVPLISILSDVSGSLRQLSLVQINGAISQLEASTIIFPNLETLDIQGCAVSIKFLASLRGWFPSLKLLKLSVMQKKAASIFDMEPEEDPLMILVFDTISKSGIDIQFVT